MDSLRLVAGIVFAVCVFLLVDGYIRDQQQQKARPPVSAQSIPEASAPVPSPQAKPAVPSPSPTPVAAAVATHSVLAGGERVVVQTDLLLAEIDTAGADLRRVELLKHRDRLDKTKNFVLLQDSPEHVYVAQSGLGPGLPSHTTRFQAASAQYSLQPGQDELRVTLTAKAEQGSAEKTYTFKRGSYAVTVDFRVTNTSATSIQPYAYFQLVRDTMPPEGASKMVPTYSGAEIYTEKDKLNKVSFEDMAAGKGTYPKDAQDGWLAFVQHYFLAAWLPSKGDKREYALKALANGLVSGVVLVPMASIEPGASSNVSAGLYVGPQEQDTLRALAPGLELAVDYGWLRPLSVPLFWVLDFIHDWVANWGVAIIILTIIIKLLFFPLSAASYRSMAKMKVVAPKMQKLKERYGDDRQKLHEAMMNLYKTEKINPLGGCLPIVVQIPVFIALYWVLLLSVELRHAPFMLWIEDLSRPDPIFVLPVLMGITMFLQTMMNPPPPDPMQARLMKVMPVAFSVFFFFFPAGLVLYWLVNNILSIAQQWQITRALERSKSARGES
jgi:YidC/Oxa1 family membrane protein insertase